MTNVLLSNISDITGADIFDGYRFLLFVIVGTYTSIRLLQFLWRWQASESEAQRPEAVLRRYIVSILMRTRFRMFWPDMMQIFILLIVFVALLALHLRIRSGYDNDRATTKPAPVAQVTHNLPEMQPSALN